MDPNMRDAKGGASVLVHACSRGWDTVVKALLDKGAVADVRDENDQGPLFFACMAGKAATVRHLIKAGVSPSKPFCKEEAVPPIVVAASRGGLPVIQELLNSGAWLDEADAQGEWVERGMLFFFFFFSFLRSQRGHTALHTACFMGSPHVAIFLIEKGANVNLRSRKGCTPLAWAASKGHTAVVKALLDKGANINGEGEGEVKAASEIDPIPLHGAARANRVDCVKLLLDRKADINLRAPYAKGMTPLHMAAIGDAKQACLELLKRGADFGAVTNEAKTVVELASEAGSVATQELLVSWEQHGGEAPPEEKPVEEPVKWQPDFSKVDPVYFKLASWMGEAQALVTAATKNEYSVCRSLLEGGTGNRIFCFSFLF